MGIERLPNPYKGFDYTKYPLDLHGWGSNASVFRRLIRDIRPNLIIEVGTWKGASALHMADICQEYDLPTKILCIDTWLGALEFWEDMNDPTRFLALDIQNGWPHVYYQFLANVCHTGHQDRIIPFPQTSNIASRWLRDQKVSADLVYIDGSHDSEDVAQDITNYSPLIRKGGVMFGDDYDWKAVSSVVSRFGQHFLDGRNWIRPL